MTLVLTSSGSNFHLTTAISSSLRLMVERNPRPGLLDKLVVAFRLSSAAVLRSEPGLADHPTLGPSGRGRGSSAVLPDEGSLVLPLTDAEVLVLVLPGPDLTAEERNILAALAAQLSTHLGACPLAHQGGRGRLAGPGANQLRPALLAPGSHDPLIPLASIKVASSSLLSTQL
jgi:two-component system sensor histidine kinase KdpD